MISLVILSVYMKKYTKNILKGGRAGTEGPGSVSRFCIIMTMQTAHKTRGEVEKEGGSHPLGC